MRIWLLALALSATLLAGAPGAAAGERTVTLKVDMYCASCPYIVKRNLETVPGVRRVDVSYARQQAVVTFEDSKADVAMLVDVCANIGFPAELVESE